MMHTLITNGDHPPHHDGHPDRQADHLVRHVSLSEYAEIAGVSPATVRRRIRRGDLTAVQVDGPYGPEWRIPVRDDHPDHQRRSPSPSPDDHGDRHDAHSDHQPADGGVAELVAVLDRLTRENVELAGRLGFYQARVQALEERIVLLEAPQPTESPQSAPGGQPDATTATTEKESAGHENEQDRRSERRPWWRFWS